MLRLKEKMLFLNNILITFSVLLWLSILFINVKDYISLITINILPILGWVILPVSLYLKKWYFALFGLLLLFSFYVTFFLGYLFLGA